VELCTIGRTGSGPGCNMLNLRYLFNSSPKDL
jgi:hypothetical protein